MKLLFFCDKNYYVDGRERQEEQLTDDEEQEDDGEDDASCKTAVRNLMEFANRYAEVTLTFCQCCAERRQETACILCQRWIDRITTGRYSHVLALGFDSARWLSNHVWALLQDSPPIYADQVNDPNVHGGVRKIVPLPHSTANQRRCSARRPTARKNAAAAPPTTNLHQDVWLARFAQPNFRFARAFTKLDMRACMESTRDAPNNDASDFCDDPERRGKRARWQLSSIMRMLCYYFNQPNATPHQRPSSATPTTTLHRYTTTVKPSEALERLEVPPSNSRKRKRESRTPATGFDFSQWKISR